MESGPFLSFHRTQPLVPLSLPLLTSALFTTVALEIPTGTKREGKKQPSFRECAALLETRKDVGTNRKLAQRKLIPRRVRCLDMRSVAELTKKTNPGSKRQCRVCNVPSKPRLLARPASARSKRIVPARE